MKSFRTGEKHKAQQLSEKAEIINTDSEICGQKYSI